MKRCVTIFLIFMVITVLFAEKAGSGIEEKAYNWESGSTEFVSDSGRDNRSVPNLIDYQGKITDSSSNPITSSVSITFTIYDDATGGINLWDETHASVTPVDGLVHVLLGSQTAFEPSLFDGSDLWLGINVNDDGEMAPRLRIVSVPYAIYANDADKLDGYDSSYFMTATTDNWIDTTGDTMTSNLVVNADFQATGITRDSGGDAGTSGQILSSTVTGTDWITVSTGSGDGHSLDAADGSPTDVVYVDNDGNVGINDDTPNYQLDIDGDIHSTGDYTCDGTIIADNLPGCDFTISPLTYLNLPLSYSNVASVTLNVDSGGYVILTFTGSASFDTEPTTIYAGIGTNINTCHASIRTKGSVGEYIPYTVQYVYSIAGAGSYTYYGNAYSTDGLSDIYDARITAIYVPIGY